MADQQLDGGGLPEGLAHLLTGAEGFGEVAAFLGLRSPALVERAVGEPVAVVGGDDEGDGGG